MITYNEYYKKAIENYKKENKNDKSNESDISDISNNIYDFTIDYNLDCESFDISNNFLVSFKNKILEEFKKNNMIQIIYLLSIKNIYVFNNEIEYISQKIIPYIEKNIYGCYLNLTRCYIYKNLKTNPNSPLMSSWLWHWDHHIDESIKVLIYLSDTNKNDAPFEFLKHNTETKGYKMPGLKFPNVKMSKQSKEKYSSILNKYKFTRILNHQLSNFKNHKPFKVLGKTGKIIIFNENIIHRANVPIENERIAIILQLKPIIHKRNKYFSKKYTKTFINETSRIPNPYDTDT